MPLTQNVSGVIKKYTKLTENVSGVLKANNSFKMNVSGVLKELFTYEPWSADNLWDFMTFHLNVSGAIGNAGSSSNYVQHSAVSGNIIELSMSSGNVSTGYQVQHSIKTSMPSALGSRGYFTPKTSGMMRITAEFTGSNTNGGTCSVVITKNGTATNITTSSLAMPITTSDKISISMSNSCSVSPSGASYTSASCKGVKLTITFDI